MNSLSTVDRSTTRAKGRTAPRTVSAVSRRFVIGVFLLSGWVCTAQPAQALDGCLLYLCQGAPDWRDIPECVPPMQQALDDLARGIPFPPCASAEELGIGQGLACTSLRFDGAGPLVNASSASDRLAITEQGSPGGPVALHVGSPLLSHAARR